MFKMSAVSGRASLLSALTWMFSLISSSSEQKSITAEPGQSVRLQCQAPNHPIIPALWIRPEVEPEDVFMCQDELLKAFRNWVDLWDRQMKDGDVCLIADTYDCQVFTKISPRPIGDSTSPNDLIDDPPVVTNITALPGQNVTLKCQVPDSSDSITGLDWSRAEMTTEYALLYRDERFHPDYQHPSFKNRVDLQDREMKDGDVSLILKNLTVNDTGTYKLCALLSAANRSKRTAAPLCVINLRVVAPPGHPGGSTNDGGKEDGSVGLIVGLLLSAVLVVVDH